MKTTCLLFSALLWASTVLATSAQMNPASGVGVEAVPATGDQSAATAPPAQPQPAPALAPSSGSAHVDVTPPANAPQVDPNATIPPPAAPPADQAAVQPPAVAPAVPSPPMDTPDMAAGSLSGGGSDAGEGSGSFGSDQSIAAPRRRHKSEDDETPTPTPKAARDKSGGLRAGVGAFAAASVIGLAATLHVL